MRTSKLIFKDYWRFLRKVLYYKTGLFMVAGACFQLVELFVKLTLTLVTTEEEKGWWFYCSEKKTAEQYYHHFL